MPFTRSPSACAEIRTTSGVRPDSSRSRLASAFARSATTSGGGGGGRGGSGGAGFGAVSAATSCCAAAARISATNTTMNSTSNSDVRSGGRRTWRRPRTLTRAPGRASRRASHASRFFSHASIHAVSFIPKLADKRMLHARPATVVHTLSASGPSSLVTSLPVYVEREADAEHGAEQAELAEQVGPERERGLEPLRAHLPAADLLLGPRRDPSP